MATTEMLDESYGSQTQPGLALDLALGRVGGNRTSMSAPPMEVEGHASQEAVAPPESSGLTTLSRLELSRLEKSQTWVLTQYQNSPSQSGMKSWDVIRAHLLIMHRSFGDHSYR